MSPATRGCAAFGESMHNIDFSVGIGGAAGQGVATPGNILAKLRVSGRVEAAAVAIRLGLTDTAATGSPPGR